MRYEHKRDPLIGQPKSGDTRKQVVHRINLIADTEDGEHAEPLFCANVMAVDSDHEKLINDFLDRAVITANEELEHENRQTASQ